MDSGDTPDELWPESVARRLDQLCDQFEQAWRGVAVGGPRPQLTEFLNQAPPADHSSLLRELFAVELHYRRALGEQPTAADYLYFPDLFQLLSGPGQADQTTVGHGLGRDEPSWQSAFANERPHRTTAVQGPTIPGYEILGVLGKGGMGVVYQARDLRLKRLVALKQLLTAGISRPEERQRFLTEAEAVARLQHPGIVQIFEFGTAEGHPYLALEFCAGGSLASRLQGVPLEPRSAAQLVEQLAHAMQFAHERGIIHRDLKPGNILLSLTAENAESAETGQSGNERTPGEKLGLFSAVSALSAVKIADFGLAKLDDAALTATSAVLGTPSYMAPEQTRDAGSVDARADVYALGAIFYECLTGRPPFRGATVLDTLEQVRHNDPVPPRQLQPALSRDLETITLKCLRKEPGQRYASAAALADDLRRFLDGQPVLARPVGWLERGWRWARRRPAQAALLGVSVLATVLLIGLGFWFSAQLGAAQAEQEAAAARTEAAERVAEAARQVAQTERYFGLENQARERITRARPGWSWDALNDLATAAKLPPARGKMAELRSLAATCLGSVDVRPAGVIGKGRTVHSIAWHPGGRQIALGERAVLANVLSSEVSLIDLDRPDQRRKLLFVPKLVWQGFQAAPDYVNRLAYSPDGRWLVAGTRSGRLHRWDLTQASPPVQSWTGHAGPVDDLVFSRNGQALYSADSKAVKRWDALDWTGKATAEVAMSRSPCLAVHPTEGYLLCGVDVLHSLQETTLQPIRPPAPYGGGQCCWTRDGRYLILASAGHVHLIDILPTRGVVQTLRRPDGKDAEDDVITDLALSPDGSLLLTSCDGSGHVKLWDLASGRMVGELVDDGLCRLAWAPDGSSFVVTGDRETRLYEVRSRHEQTLAALHGEAINSAALHPDGRQLGCLREYGAPKNWEMSLWPLEGELPREPSLRRTSTGEPSGGAPRPLAFAPQQPWLTCFFTHLKCLISWHLTSGEVKTVPNLDLGGPLSFAPDGRFWTTTTRGVRAWVPGQATPVAAWDNLLGRALTGKPAIHAVAAGARWVGSVGQDGALRTFLAGSGQLQEHAERQLTAEGLSCLALQEDAGLALAGSAAGRLVLVRWPAGPILATREAHEDQVVAVAISPTGLLVSGGRDGTIKLSHWDGKDLQELFTLAHTRPIRWLALRADGVTLAVLLEGERAVRLWRLDRLRHRFAQLGLEAGLECLTAAPLPTPAPVQPPNPPTSPPEGPHGLKLEVFDEPDLHHCVRLGYEPIIAWRQLRQEKDPEPPTPVGLRWSGWLRAARTGQHIIRLRCHARCKLWLAGQLCLDSWQVAGEGPREFQVELSETPLAVKLETLDPGNKEPALHWSLTGVLPEERIPIKAFYHDRHQAARPPPAARKKQGDF